MSPTADVLIVGAGPYGLSCAWWIASRYPELDVMVIDEGDFACGGVGRNAAGIRMQWGLELNIKLCQESIAFFEQAEERLDYPDGIELKQTGYLLLAHDASAYAQLERNQVAQHKLGVPSRMLDADECIRLVPALNRDHLYGGAFCGKDGSVSPFRWMDALFRAARREGVKIEMGCRVERLVQQDDRFLALTTGQNNVSAAKVLICTDWAAPELLSDLGIDLPISGVPKQGLVTEAWSTRLEPIVISFKHDLAINQVKRGNIVAIVSEDRPDGNSKQCTPDFLNYAASRVLDCLPGLDGLKVLRTWGGVASKTPDMQAILGETEISNLYLAVSAYKGFMTSPAVGRIMSEAMFSDDPHPEVEPFSAVRFKTGNLIPEPTTV